MSRQTTSRVAWLMLALATFTGCSPTQPFYFHEDGDLSHYLDKATEIEYPDVHTEALADTTQSEAPLTLSNPDFKEMWDLTLEECICITLQNSKTIRSVGAVTDLGGFTRSMLGTQTDRGDVFLPAIQASEPGSPFSRSFLSGPGTLNFPVTSGGVGGVEAALADFDALLSVQSTPFNHTDRSQNRPDNDFFPPINDTESGSMTSAIIKKTASGAVFKFENNTAYDRWNGPFPVGSSVGPFRRVNSAWETTFEARWDQPLLRGRGTMINRIPILLARINEDISLVGFEVAVRDLVLDVENTYWDLHRAYRNVETSKIGRDSAQGAWRIVYEKFNEGVAPAQEEAYAREQYFQFRAVLERSLQELYTTETRLRWLMGLAATDGRLIRPIDELTMARVEFDWTSIRTESLVRSPELRSKRWELKQRELELVSAKNQLLPQLDMALLYRWFGLGDELMKAHGSGKDFATTDGAGTTAFEELAGGKYQEAQISFNLRMPVGFRRELAGVRNAQLRLAREKSRLEDMELQQVHLMSSWVRDVDAFYVQSETHFNRWSAAEKEVESATAKWKGGADTVDTVLEAQRRRAEAQVEFYRSLVDYNKAIAKVHWQKGSLLEYNNIELTEGNWPHKAYWDALALARQRDASYYLNYGWTRPDVVSRGPVDQGIGGSFMGQPTPAEVIPAPEPAPAGPAPAEGQPAPESGPTPQALPAPPSAPAPEIGPLTGGPAGPMLNAPLVRSATAGPAGGAVDNPLRTRSFEWGALGLDQLRPGAAPVAQPWTNALRPAAPEAASPVQPAGYSVTINDTPDRQKPASGGR